MSDTASITFRVPRQWKARWLEEAKSRKKSLSDLIKERAITASEGTNTICLKIGNEMIPLEVLNEAAIELRDKI